jgi:sec-independent protein translocase protein TatC
VLRAALLVALLAASGSALALEATSHAWTWEVFEGKAQVRDVLHLTGPGAALRLEVPPGARDVQAFAAGVPLPWRWVGDGTLEVALPAGRDPAQPFGVEVRHAVGAGPAGVQAVRALTVPVAALQVGATLPPGWVATLDGQPLGQGDLGARPAGTTLALRLAPAPGPSPLAVLAGLTALTLALALAMAARARGKAVPEEQGLLDHLRELSARLRAVILAVAVLMVFLFTFALVPSDLGFATLPLPLPSLSDNIAAQTFRLVAQQFVPPGVELVVVDPVSGALTQVEVALFLALLVASPLLGYQVGAFLMPALLPHERRVLYRAIPAFTFLFVAGALFAYLLMVPTMMQVLYGYAEGLGARPLIAVNHLVSFAIVVTLVFGLAFELPILMVALAKLNIATPQAMAAKWRHVVVGLFVLAAIITPDPSVISQVLVALPLLGLYAIGLVAARAAVRAPAEEGQASAA